MRLPVYAALSVAVLITVPLQVLFIRIFKAHADELKSEAGYSELPTEEPQTAWKNSLSNQEISISFEKYIS